MKQRGMSPRHEQLYCIASLPQKMVSLAVTSNLAEFVLHELCNTRCFRIAKAAYFIDNVDFDCLKGVAGYDKDNEFLQTDSWNSPQEFTQHMGRCIFNQKVRTIVFSSPRRASIAYDESIRALSERLDMPKCEYYTWALKHNNQGILLYNVAPNSNSFNKELLCAFHILAFCPVF